MTTRGSARSAGSGPTAGVRPAAFWVLSLLLVAGTARAGWWLIPSPAGHAGGNRLAQVAGLGAFPLMVAVALLSLVLWAVVGTVLRRARSTRSRAASHAAVILVVLDAALKGLLVTWLLPDGPATLLLAAVAAVSSVACLRLAYPSPRTTG